MKRDQNIGDRAHFLLMLAAGKEHMEGIEDIARNAYKAYGSVTDFKNYQGLPMPEFDDLPNQIKEAWKAACLEVLKTSNGI